LFYFTKYLSRTWEGYPEIYQRILCVEAEHAETAIIFAQGYADVSPHSGVGIF